MKESSGQAQGHGVDANQRLHVVESENVPVERVSVHMEHVQITTVSHNVPMADNAMPSTQVPRVPIWPRLRAFMQTVQMLVTVRNKNNDATQQLLPAAASQVKINTPEAASQGLKAQITDLDRAHLQAFSPERKAEVMDKIMSLTPVHSVMHRGGNQFEKAVLNMHREGYRLIDMQPHETAFTTVWYRKDPAFMSKRADVMMLLWEDSEDADSTTIMSWKI